MRSCVPLSGSQKYTYNANGIRFHRISGWATGSNIGFIRPATDKDIIRLGNSAAKQ